MRANKYVIFKMESDFYEKVITASGIELFIDSTVNKNENARMEATLVCAPSWMNIPEGSKLLVHYNARQNKMVYNGETYYWEIPENVYGYYDYEGQFKPLRNLVFVEPIVGSIEAAKSILEVPDVTKKPIKCFGIVRYIGDDVIEKDALKPGALVNFLKNREYEMNVSQHILYCMDETDITGVILDDSFLGQYEPLNLKRQMQLA